MSQSVQSTASSDSPHHVGAVGRISDDALSAALGQYVEACKTPSQAFDLKGYNFLRKSQAVRGQDLLNCKPLLFVLCDTLLGLRFTSTQMQAALLTVLKQHKCNTSSRDDVDWARAVCMSISVLCTHARRLRNEALYQQCRVKVLTSAGRAALDELRDTVSSVAPLKETSSDDRVLPIASVGAKRPASPCRASRPTRKLRSRDTAVPHAECTQVDYPLDEEGLPIDPYLPDGVIAVIDPDAGPDADAGTSSSDSCSDDEDTSTSDATSSPPRGVARGPAPTKLTKEQLQLANRRLARSVRQPLSGAVQLKAASGAQPAVDESHAQVGTVSIGKIGLWLERDESFIKVLDGHTWKYIVTVHSSHSDQHQSIVRRIFRRSIEMDYDEDDMRAERSFCLS